MVRGSANPRWKGGLPHCVECGEELSSYTANRCAKCKSLPLIGTKRPLEVRIKLHKAAKKGPDHHAWKHGKTSVFNQPWRGFYADLWREAVLERDNHTCQDCGIQSTPEHPVRLEAHHIKDKTDFPELMFDVDNGLTLCKPCHTRTDNFGFRKANELMRRRRSGDSSALGDDHPVTS